jgi:exopolysaccharide production protein ExoQ
MDVPRTISEPVQLASWTARCAAALTVSVALWLVGHSISESRRIVQEEALGASRVQNRYAERSKETTMTSAVGFFLVGGMGVLLWMQSAPGALNWRHGLMLCCLMFVGWNFISLLWTIDAMQSIRKLAIFGLMLVGAFGLAARFELEDLIWIGILSLTGLIIIALLAEAAYGTFRPWRHDYRFAGTCHPNDQGLQCAMLALLAGFAEFTGRDRPWLRRWLMALGLLGLALSKSRTTLVALIAAAAIALVLRSRGLQRWLVAAGCIAVLSAAGILSSFVTVSALNDTANVAAMGRRQNLSSLTGRLPLWEEVWKAAEQRLAVGYGNGAFWNEKNVLKYSEIFGWHIPHAHNSYLDLILQVGLVGLVLYLFWLIGTALAALVRYDRSQRPAELFAVCFMAFALVHGLCESKVPGAGEPGLLLLAVMAMLAAQPPRMHLLPAAALNGVPSWRQKREWRCAGAPALSGKPLRGGASSQP